MWVNRSVDEVMWLICRSAADAVYRYTEVAGQICNENSPGLFMPEYFLPSFVLDRLGGFLTMSLETNAKTLFEFTRDVRKSRIGADTLRLVMDELRNDRTDLVVYQGDSPRKEEQAPILLVEFKTLKRFSQDKDDREKLLRALKLLDAPLLGAVCSVLDSKTDFSLEEIDARADGDRWYKCDVPELPHANMERFSVCARLLNTAKPSL